MFGLHHKKNSGSPPVGGLFGGGRFTDSYEIGLRQFPGFRPSLGRRKLRSGSSSSLPQTRENSIDLSLSEQDNLGKQVSAPPINNTDNVGRRVWVKRPNKVATAIVVGPDSIVDDLKYIIMQKFPTSLAVQCDPADLDIVAEIATVNSASSAPVTKTIISPPGSFPSLNGEKLRTSMAKKIGEPAVIDNSSNNATMVVTSLGGAHRRSSSTTPVSKVRISQPTLCKVVLEPDLLVYAMMDTYYPNGMSMQDALIIQPQQDKGKGDTLSAVDDLKHASRYVSRPGKGEPSIPLALELSPATSSSKGAVHGIQRLQSPAENSVLRKKSTISDFSVQAASPSSTVILFPKPVKPEIRSPIAEAEEGGGSKKLDAAPAAKNNGVLIMSPTPIATSFKNYEKSIMDIKLQLNPGISKILAHINVLVVEDNLVNQKIMARHLKSCNVGFKIAATGKEALEMWREGGFHLCFMDIQLPVMSGIEVTREIRRLERLNRIGNFATSTTSEDKSVEDSIPEPEGSDKLDLDLFRSPIIIVALTASTGAEDQQKALAAGCNDYLTKPVQLKWLRSKLTEWGCMQALINYDYFRSDF
ncbi:DEKNAAC100590 [Brettanomyces naardenensis]|uniref:DEKNAAC100590 n=1 Tax=Brettanomyces naardenensis TaxID=13370 RepID=A0A448YFU5_BRENA|nr:DEKNAAC100590 [Brettanomyces naardenensis]